MMAHDSMRDHAEVNRSLITLTALFYTHAQGQMSLRALSLGSELRLPALSWLLSLRTH